MRARRTIIAADCISLIAATVLWILSVGGVRGFAFTLGLTTVIDLVVVFLFTKPVITLLARTQVLQQRAPDVGAVAEPTRDATTPLTTEPRKAPTHGEGGLT